MEDTLPVKRLKSDGTRDRIALAARKIFGIEGYDRATIRAIAEEANIHASMVMRYYGSKEALFASVVPFDLRLPDLSAVPPSQRGVALVRHFLERWEDGDGDLTALLRAAVSHPEARSRMARIFEEQLTTAINAIVEPNWASACATLIASQLLGLALIQYVLGFESARTLDPVLIIATLGATVQSYLDGPSKPSHHLGRS